VVLAEEGRALHHRPFIGIVLLVGVLLCNSPPTRAGDVAEQVAELLAEAKGYWTENSFYLALERLGEASRLAPRDARVYKFQGDLLMTLRRNQEALASYRQAAELAPDALEIHWAIWALLDRLGGQQPAILSLQDIARLDPANPLVHIRLARALSQVDRLEDHRVERGAFRDVGPVGTRAL
jgi:Flp pilus assembly protein TadD